MDKRISLDELVAAVPDGGMVAFGGNGLRRKPMAAAKAIATSSRASIDVAVMLGGPEVDLLVGLGKVRNLHFAYVGFDRFGLAPNFRAARERGALAIVEYSEGTILSAFDAGAQLLPFMPTRRGLGTDLLTMASSPFKTFPCPITGEALVAVPALAPDLAIIHVNEADRAGNGVIYGDPFIDPLVARSARKVFLTAERVVDAVPRGQPENRATLISRLWIDGVCELPGGARLTGLFPEYLPDAPAIV